ncbi:MAG TPA: polysaccharide deacetylase family protein [Pyrinomonadaceae bacterium]|nr:polysaccharide deacetylase family protein [Pyrinomonadaceae bacterium]
MLRKILLFQILIFGFISVSAQSKQIAFTIDDLPLNGPSIEQNRLKKMTEKLVSALKKNNIPMVGFINESLIYQTNEADARIAILKMWRDGGIELGNHTFSHLGFANAALADFEDDFIKGDSVTKMLLKPQKPRYFRHPFLQMGKTRELEEQFRKFIGERGYTAVPVTVGTYDWMFLTAYEKGLKEKDKKFQKRVSDDYLKFVADSLEAAEKGANELFGRYVKQILLLHANELNADNFEALIEIFKKKNYEFISVEEALKDEIYVFPERYAPTSDWLGHWAFSKGKNLQMPKPPEYIEKIFQGK